jgi:hypothetical protein
MIPNVAEKKILILVGKKNNLIQAGTAYLS